MSYINPVDVSFAWVSSKDELRQRRNKCVESNRAGVVQVFRPGYTPGILPLPFVPAYEPKDRP